MFDQQNANVIIGDSLSNSNSNLRSTQKAPFEELNFNLGRSSEIIAKKPQVSVTLSPTTVVEGSGIPLVYSFNLSKPAPKRDLQLKFLVSDSDGGQDDASGVGFESKSSNIADTSFAIENGSAFFFVDIAPGASGASLAVGAYEDNVVEGSETVVFSLVDNKNSYTIDPKNSFVIATIKDT